MAFFFGASSDVHTNLQRESRIPVAGTGRSAPTGAGLPSVSDPRKSLSVAEDVNVVLKFDGYFKEAVPESPDERWRLRHVKIAFYVDDESFLVTEPRVDNSGLTQGLMFRRQRMTKSNGDPFSFMDLSIPGEIAFYGTKFYLCSCNEFTKNFLTSHGVELGEFREVPVDHYAEKHRVQIQGRSHVHKKPFYSPQDDTVLRFFIAWEDTSDLCGDVLKYALHYYVGPQMMEIKEIREVNDGREPVSAFLRKGKVAKHFVGVKDITEEDTDLWYPDDLKCGETIEVLCRQFFLYDCDPATRRWYKNVLGIEQHTFPIPSQDEDEDDDMRVEAEIPPPTGFGSEEDSLSAWKSLVAKPPPKRIDTTKEGKILRFTARMESNTPVERERRFVISYFLADNTISVFEPPIRNSGIQGGTFLRRQKVQRPDQPPEVELGKVPIEYYKEQDFYVGAHLVFHHRQFVLIDADNYALRYMEVHTDDFPQSCAATIMARLRGQLKQQGADPQVVFQASSAYETVPMDRFSELLVAANLGIEPQEILTLARRYDLKADGRVNRAEFCAALL